MPSSSIIFLSMASRSRVSMPMSAGADYVVYVCNGLVYGHTVVLGRVAITKNEGLVHADGGAGGSCGGADRTVLGYNVDLDHRAALAVDDLACVNLFLMRLPLSFLAGSSGTYIILKSHRFVPVLPVNTASPIASSAFKAGVAAQVFKKCRFLFHMRRRSWWSRSCRLQRRWFRRCPRSRWTGTRSRGPFCRRWSRKA